MAIPVTNNMVQRIIIDLIEDYCEGQGLTLTAEMLKKERGMLSALACSNPWLTYHSSDYNNKEP